MSHLPRRLIAVAGLSCFVGAIAVVDTLRDSFAGRGILINGFVILLPIGLGLFRCRLSSRRWATFFAAMMVTILVGSGIFGTATGGVFVRVDMLGLSMRGTDAMVATWAMIMATTATCIAAMWILYTPPVSGLFAQAGPREVMPSATDESPALPVYQAHQPDAQ